MEGRTVTSTILRGQSLVDLAGLLLGERIDQPEKGRGELLLKIEAWFDQAEDFMGDPGAEVFGARLEHLKGLLFVKMGALKNFQEEDDDED